MEEDLDLLSTRDDGETAVVDGRVGNLSVAELRALREEWRQRLRADRKVLVEIARPRSLDGLGAYLAALSLGHAVLLVDGAPPGLASSSREAFRPDVSVNNGAVTWLPWAKARTSDLLLHPALAMVVSTSGSVGAAKAVRLSYDNLSANARSIAEATGIRPEERAATSLPADYAFGLSIINSYLISNGVLALTESPPTSRGFWWQLDQLGASAVGLLPTTCRLLLARGWSPRSHPSLERVLIAGGRLDPPEARVIADLMRSVNGLVNIMYGQAEATARISVLDTTSALTHPGSVGRVVPGGRVEILAEEETPVRDGERGEIVYRGPNVMLGYATARTDLGLGDVHRGRLRTGDLGYLSNGFLYLTGRVDRQVKILGRRIQLDQMEGQLRSALDTEVMVIPLSEEMIAVCHEGGVSVSVTPVVERVAGRWGLPRACLRVREMPLPRLHSGKLDYRGISLQLAGIG
ncbi:AMP-binding protein [Plantactinospora sp. B5E13]|uniref:AMP-binding protein n=1 Tax=unclassified Plantactinospora TaxID=2631981 RepID=UPI00325EEDFC